RLLATATGRSDQESPPTAPLVNGVAFEIKDGSFGIEHGGSEISPDRYSRVKVQFHWDREGKTDSDSSCWIRVEPPGLAGDSKPPKGGKPKPTPTLTPTPTPWYHDSFFDVFTEIDMSRVPTPTPTPTPKPKPKPKSIK